MKHRKTIEKIDESKSWFSENVKKKKWQNFLLEWSSQKERLKLLKSGMKGGHQYWPYRIKNNYKGIRWTTLYK